MLKENELRIGNLLRDKVSKTELEVIELTKENIVTYVIDRSMFPLKDGWGIEPIPLTEEWLLGFGFEKSKQGSENFYHLQLRGRIWIRFIDYDCNNLDLVQDGKIIAFPFGVIKYAHQLQNLYFALTGEELTLKDNEQND